jgi:hypothetical protein
VSLRDRLAVYLKQHEGAWIDGRELGTIAGAYAWRSRIAECRTVLGMDIANRCRLVRRADGSAYKLSEYMYRAKGQGVLWEQKSA